MSELKTRKDLIIEALNRVNADILQMEVNIIFCEQKKEEAGEQPEINQAILNALVSKEQAERSREILLDLQKKL